MQTTCNPREKLDTNHVSFHRCFGSELKNNSTFILLQYFAYSDPLWTLKQNPEFRKLIRMPIPKGKTSVVDPDPNWIRIPNTDPDPNLHN